jgi:hypothetical protein
MSASENRFDITAAHKISYSMFDVDYSNATGWDSGEEKDIKLGDNPRGSYSEYTAAQPSYPESTSIRTVFTSSFRPSPMKQKAQPQSKHIE